MKIIIFMALFTGGIFFSSASSAQTSDTIARARYQTIKVWGNCGMCKETIEDAAKKAGVTSADWNEETKELKVIYAPGKTSSEKIQQKIAKAGYDTQDFTASEKAYKALHGCCKYDRKDPAVN